MYHQKYLSKYRGSINVTKSNAMSTSELNTRIGTNLKENAKWIIYAFRRNNQNYTGASNKNLTDFSYDTINPLEVFQG